MKEEVTHLHYHVSVNTVICRLRYFNTL
jgi:hypothetical protein